MTLKNKTENKTEFSWIRAMFWPIYKKEVKKVLLMGMLLFCMLFQYSVVRVLKDNFILSAKSGGATLIPFLKTFFIIPSAAGFVALYAVLNRKFEKQTIFYMIAGVFGAFFFIFGNFMFPNSSYIHMSDATLSAIKLNHPRLASIMSVFGLWSFSVFYVFAEIWGTVGVSQLFWQFANEVTTPSESKRFYITFQSIGNYALIIAALTVERTLTGTVGLHVGSVRFACNLVFFFTLVSMIIYYLLSGMVFTASEKKSKTEKPGLIESAKIVFRSKHLLYITLLLICYGISINFVEVTWKDLMAAYSKESGIPVHIFQARALLYTGISTVVISTLGKGIVAYLGWRATALFTPIGITVSGLLFFAARLSPSTVMYMSSKIGYTALGFGVLIGTIQNVFAKSTKYVLFDTTKEMAYIPLDPVLKNQGKAAVEVVGGRSGKGLGGLIQTMIFIVTGSTSLLSATPYLAFGLMTVCLVWITAVNLLNMSLNKLTPKENQK